MHTRSRGAYGAPRVHAVLQREGRRCGRRRIAPLMRQAQLAGRCRRRRMRTTVADPQAPWGPDLVRRDFAPDPAALDARWCGDVTCIATEEGWLYLATVIDIALRKAVGWATSDHPRTSLVADALTAACRNRRPGPGLIFHAGRGCQYTSREFAQVAASFGIQCRLVGPGCAGTTPWRSRSSLPSSASWAPAPPGVDQPGRRPLSDLRAHRGLVQRPPPAQQPGLPQLHRVRGRPRGLTGTTTVSVKPEQAQTASLRACELGV